MNLDMVGPSTAAGENMILLDPIQELQERKDEFAVGFDDAGRRDTPTRRESEGVGIDRADTRSGRRPNIVAFASVHPLVGIGAELMGRRAERWIG